MKILKTIIFLALITSCTHHIDALDALMKENNLTLTVYREEKGLHDSSSVTLTQESQEITELSNWLSNNKKGWKSDFNSWIHPDFTLTGNDFRLLIYNDFVVLGYTDKNNKPSQFTRKVNIKELEFLINNFPGSKAKYFNGMNFPDFEEPNSGLGRAMVFGDTLEIKVDFYFSSEWGGRTEKIDVYRDENRKLMAHLMIYRDSFDPEVSNMIKTDTIKSLTTEDERLMNLFIHRVLELSLNQEYYNLNDSTELHEIAMFVDSGWKIEISNSSKDLFISFDNIDLLANTWYGFVRKRIFGITFH